MELYIKNQDLIKKMNLFPQQLASAPWNNIIGHNVCLGFFLYLFIFLCKQWNAVVHVSHFKINNNENLEWLQFYCFFQINVH